MDFHPNQQRMKKFIPLTVFLAVVFIYIFATVLPNYKETYHNVHYLNMSKVKSYDDQNDNNHDYKGFKKRLPGCIIIGVKKGGTGALVIHLNMHPEIASQSGEPDFFSKNPRFARGFEYYRKQMPKSSPGQITIEKSPSYFKSLETPKRISELNKDMKIILAVRDPVTRTISDYVHTRLVYKRRKDHNPNILPFEMCAINGLTGTVNEEWYAINTSRYSEHFEKWLKFFPREQIHVVDGDRYITDPVSELRKIESFLGVERWFKDEHFEYDKKKGFMCTRDDSNTLSCLSKGKGREHPDVHPRVLQALKEYFTPYNKKFYELAGRDFGWERNGILTKKQKKSKFPKFDDHEGACFDEMFKK